MWHRLRVGVSCYCWTLIFITPLILAHPNPSLLRLRMQVQLKAIVWQEESLSACEWLVIVWRWCNWCCSSHSGCELCHYVGVCGGMALTSLCVFWGCAVLVAMFMDFWLAFRGKLFVENGCPWGTGWWCSRCPGPSLPVQLPVIGVHQMNTSSSSCHTPVADVLKWVWLDIL